MVKASPSQTLNEALHQASFFLQQAGFEGEMARVYWQMLFDWDLTRTLRELHQIQPTERLSRFEDAVKRILKDEPIQYIAGFAYFMEDRFQVSPACLIPREETQGVVERGISYLRNRSQATILDLGTGSGIIAIEVKKALPHVQVWASDISQEALDLAKENAHAHQVEINFIRSDIFDQFPAGLNFDLILSNPPYISYDDQGQMDASVKKYEPKEALYADQGGLAIYQRILDQASRFLYPGGQIIFEIGYQQADALDHMVRQHDQFHLKAIGQDGWGKDRYVQIAFKKEL
ncbi:peptide chain release factor N(5)-glutamine methyltransferase [Facklamia languida]